MPVPAGKRFVLADPAWVYSSSATGLLGRSASVWQDWKRWDGVKRRAAGRSASLITDSRNPKRFLSNDFQTEALPFLAPRRKRFSGNDLGPFGVKRFGSEHLAGRGGLEKGGRAVSPTEALPRLESFRKPARRAGVGMKEVLRWGKTNKGSGADDDYRPKRFPGNDAGSFGVKRFGRRGLEKGERFPWGFGISPKKSPQTGAR